MKIERMHSHQESDVPFYSFSYRKKEVSFFIEKEPDPVRTEQKRPAVRFRMRIKTPREECCHYFSYHDIMKYYSLADECGYAFENCLFHIIREEFDAELKEIGRKNQRKMVIRTLAGNERIIEGVQNSVRLQQIIDKKKREHFARLDVLLEHKKRSCKPLLMHESFYTEVRNGGAHFCTRAALFYTPYFRENEPMERKWTISVRQIFQPPELARSEAYAPKPDAFDAICLTAERFHDILNSCRDEIRKWRS